MPVPSFAVSRYLRRLHLLRSRDPVDEEFRGWNWSRPPIKPRAYLGLSISDLIHPCETKRYVWLRRVEGIRPRINNGLVIGGVVHEVISRVIIYVTRSLYGSFKPWKCISDVRDLVLKVVSERDVSDESIREWLVDVAEYIAVQLIADASWSMVGCGVGSFMPWVSEVRVDGTFIGLSKDLRIDAIVNGNVIVEFKVTKPNPSYRLALAGYALALESNWEVPIDYGLLIYINGVGGKPKVTIEPVYISNDLRRDFLEVRDEVIDMMLSERKPPVAHNCPPSCPFRYICKGEGDA